MNISIHADTFGMVMVCIVLVLAAAGYFVLWDRVDSHMARVGNVYDMTSDIKSRSLRAIAKILAIATWPLWSFVQMLLGLVTFTLVSMYAFLVDPVVRLVSSRRKR